MWHSPVTVGEGQNPLTDPEPVDSERRTFEWITQLSVPSLSEADATDMTSLTSDSQAASISPGDISTKQSVPCDFRLVTAVDVQAHVKQPVFNVCKSVFQAFPDLEPYSDSLGRNGSESLFLHW